ncbi:polyphosphate kinase 1 [Kolteria novifilia]|uniref:polyphosphate kinase 1 n=1 Tax=Kolteria novifilia TaxID=2527975 RepID=UPI003AF360A5
MPNAASELHDSRLYINRELSWLEFNSRVLEEGLNPDVPLLERLKFLAIFSSNLDEFFMVRVSILKKKIASGITTSSGGDKMLPRDQYLTVTKRVHELVDELCRCLHEAVLPGLRENGIAIRDAEPLSPEQRDHLRDLFTREIFPVLTPLAIDLSHPFPHLLNGSSNLAVRLRRKKESRQLLAVVQLPSVLPRYVPVSSEDGDELVPIERIIRENIEALFPGMVVIDSFVFRVTRDADFDLDDYEEIKDLAEKIERQIRERRRGAATRLEIEAEAPLELVEFLREALDLETSDVYQVSAPVGLTGLFDVYHLAGHEELRDPPHVPRVASIIADASSVFSAIREGDILLHHPYDSFKPVVDFISAAADDPKVLAIKQTLYRTSSDSPIVGALKRAADQGKQVTALVELQARMDEERNIAWARELEKSGVHVVYGILGLKTHCKVCLVVRRDESKIHRYVHLSTGNYNPQTAQFYTDVGILTADEAFADDASALFNYLTGYGELPSWKRLIVAPSRLRSSLVEMIQAETALGPEGRIVAKINAVLEPSVIRALYAASQAGVRIDLICRGICALRPGVPGISDNIRVRSIIDRFLEHSRIYYFGNQGQPRVYLASADWMDRNLLRRIEIAVPIEDPLLRAQLIEILNVNLSDNVKAHELTATGQWNRVTPSEVTDETAPRVRAQQYLLRAAARNPVDPPLLPVDEALPFIVDERVSRKKLLKGIRKKRRAERETNS